MSTPATHGGPGRNQGRRTLNRTAKTVRITITLTEAELAYLDSISPGANRSEGVRWALHAQQREAKVLLAEVSRLSSENSADPSLLVSDEDLERDILAKTSSGVAVHVAH